IAAVDRPLFGLAIPLTRVCLTKRAYGGLYRYQRDSSRIIPTRSSSTAIEGLSRTSARAEFILVSAYHVVGRLVAGGRRIRTLGPVGCRVPSSARAGGCMLGHLLHRRGAASRATKHRDQQGSTSAAASR